LETPAILDSEKPVVGATKNNYKKMLLFLLENIYRYEQNIGIVFSKLESVSFSGVHYSHFATRTYFKEVNWFFTEVVLVRDLVGRVCNVVLIKCTLDLGKPKGGWNFGREGTGAR
jgi:hypothetical protein